MTLRLENIGKQYAADVWGVRDVDLELPQGIHGLLGPNGAGKSTLMRIITTVSEPTTGTAYWNDTDIAETPSAVRDALGYLPQRFGAYPDLTAAEFLEYVAALRGLDRDTAAARIDELLALTNLRDVRDRKLRTFSGGMRQRVGIAQALVNDPELLVVDEPTVGLDPAERVRFRNVIASAASDRVVLLSTHIVPDIEATAQTVALLDDGELVTHAEPETLLEATRGKVYECVVPRDELEALRRRYQVSSTVQRADGVSVRVIAEGRPVPGAETVRPTLEDAYLDRIDRAEGTVA